MPNGKIRKARGSNGRRSPPPKNGRGKFRFASRHIKLSPVFHIEKDFLVHGRCLRRSRKPPGFGTPYTWATTDLMSGGTLNMELEDPSLIGAGRQAYEGVLVHVRAQPESGCRGELDGNHDPQALWVFSADSCGVYGMSGIRIAHAGRTEPLGEIVISAHSGNVNVRDAIVMILRVAP